MIHYGDIRELSGYTLPLVDVITSGSPCQGFSEAGGKTGLSHEESGLFTEQIRIIKEMHERTADNIYPRYLLWENVDGALSRHEGRDFQDILLQISRVAQPGCPAVPLPEKLWPNVGLLYDELGRWSIAWRIHDAQFWGVPQRRKRVALVADFRGLSVPEILFIRKGNTWYPAESEQPGQGTTGDTGECADGTAQSYTLKMRVGNDIDKYGKRAGKGPLIQTELSNTLRTKPDQTLFQPLCYDARGTGSGRVSPTLVGDHQRRVSDHTGLLIDNYVVRRFTPLECERLMGLPDDWTKIDSFVAENGKRYKCSDMQRYMAIGNSIALPFWQYVARRICAQYERDITMGSLFDGVSGFPYVFSRCGAVPIWSSETNPFCRAVAEAHFPGENHE